MGKGIARVSGTTTSSYTPPAAASNITGATVVVGYVYDGNASSLLLFSGVMTLPASVPTEIDIVAVDPSGNQYPVQVVTNASGSTFSYSGVTAALQPATNQSWSLTFTVKNSAGTPTPAPYTVTGVTVAAPSVSAITGADLTASRYADPNGALHAVIQATVSTTSTQAMNVTLWKTGGSAGTQWLGWWKVTTAGQVVQIGTPASNMTMLYAPVLANETWQIAAAAGCIDSAAAIPSGAVYSSGFSVVKPANLAATVCSGAYIDAVTYAGRNSAGVPFGWGNLYCTIARSSSLFAIRFTVQTGSGTGGSFVAGGAHPNEDPVNYADGHFYDVPTNQVVGSGSLTIDVSNGNNWLIPVDGNATHRIRVYVQTQAQANSTPPTWTQQTCWSSGVGVSTAGTNAYQDLVVDATKAISVVGPGLTTTGGIGNISIPSVLTAGQNVLQNPAFANSNVSWYPWGIINGSFSPGNGPSGGNCVLLNAAGYAQVDSPSIPVNPGDQWAIAVLANSLTGATVAELQVQINLSSGGPVYQNINMSPPGSTWTVFGPLSVAMPALAVSMAVTANLNGSPGGQWQIAEFWAVLLSPGNTISTSSAGAVTSNNGNMATSVLADPSFEYSPLGLIVLGGGSSWVGDGARAFVIAGSGHSGNRFLELNGSSSGSLNAYAYQIVSVVPGQPYYVSAWVQSNSPSGGGTHQLTLEIDWFDKSGNVLSGSTNSFSVSGHVSSWTLGPAGFITAPATAATARIFITTATNEPSDGVWYVDDVNLQPVINQTGNGQVQSTNPAAQSSGYSALKSSSATTSAASTYGLSYANITASDGSFAQMAASVGGGSIGFGAAGGNTCSIGANTGGAFCSMNAGSSAVYTATVGSTYSSMSHNGFVSRNQTGVTETLAASISAGRHVVGGIIVP